MNERSVSTGRAPRRQSTAAFLVGAAVIWVVSFAGAAMHATGRPASAPVQRVSEQLTRHANGAVRRSAPRVSVSGVRGRSPRINQDPMEDAFWKVCGDCHDPDRIRETRRTRGGWEDVIYQMVDKGAIGTERDFDLALQYLLAHYGLVNVNQAEAPEIALVTGLAAKEAESVVAFRKANGNFKNFDELKKVPGIDVDTLDAHRLAILF
jgi:competence protein ComEA